MVPSENDHIDEDDLDEESDSGTEKKPGAGGDNWEMGPMHASGVPFTPRTQAFNNLGGAGIGQQPKIPDAYY